MILDNLQLLIGVMNSLVHSPRRVVLRPNSLSLSEFHSSSSSVGSTLSLPLKLSHGHYTPSTPSFIFSQYRSLGRDRHPGNRTS